MEFFIGKKVQKGTFDELNTRIREVLKEEGFGVITEIDIKKTLKEKIDVDFRNYTILGACNPAFAHKALTANDKIGTLLPCNVVIQENAGGELEVMAFDPASAMMDAENPQLTALATEVRDKLTNVLDKIE